MALFIVYLIPTEIYFKENSSGVGGFAKGFILSILCSGGISKLLTEASSHWGFS